MHIRFANLPFYGLPSRLSIGSWPFWFDIVCLFIFALVAQAFGVLFNKPLKRRCRAPGGRKSGRPPEFHPAWLSNTPRSLGQIRKCPQRLSREQALQEPQSSLRGRPSVCHSHPGALHKPTKRAAREQHSLVELLWSQWRVHWPPSW